MIPLYEYANVFVPNTFSPNSDGSNDVFYPRGTGIDRAKVLRIFNRWGEIVYERYDFPINSASHGWDGNWKGKKANADVYIYQLEVYCQNGEVVGAPLPCVPGTLFDVTIGVCTWAANVQCGS